MSMEEDYRRDQEMIRKNLAAARALQEVIDFYNVTMVPRVLSEARDRCKMNAEQKQSVWN